VAKLTTSLGMVLAMALHAACHAGNIFHLRDDIHFGNLAVALFALETSFEM
jgi:hypothetical protein